MINNIKMPTIGYFFIRSIACISFLFVTFALGKEGENKSFSYSTLLLEGNYHDISIFE